MSAKPVLVLQMRRMGDLILSFPLLLALERKFPGHPLWLVGNPLFFQPLLPLAPQAVFFPPEHLPTLQKQAYAGIVNLSAQGEAAEFAHQASAEFKLGLSQSAEGKHFAGFWQLYRAGLTQNNRHNAFHWADLNLLDLVSLPYRAPSTVRNNPETPSGRVGLVLGASDRCKHPGAEFWARLARRLIALGKTPMLLGGSKEKSLGEEVARKAQIPKANLCGKLELAGLARLMPGLDLVVTPDTGPMHLANWLGLPVLNLSLGPVHARETGPLAPDQWILRAKMSCVGCWKCQQKRLLCHDAFHPASVAGIIASILEKKPLQPLNGLELLRSSRDNLGLYHLAPLDNSPSARFVLEDFWQAAFLYFNDPAHAELLSMRSKALAKKFPALSRSLGHNLGQLLEASARQARHGAFADNFWQSQPEILRLLAGQQQIFLENNNYSPSSWHTVLERLDSLHKPFLELA